MRFAPYRWLAMAYCLIGSGVVACAAPIVVNNPSFERPALDAGGWGNELADAEPNPEAGGSDWIGRNGTNNGNTFIEYIDGFRSEGNQHLGMQGNYFVFQNTGVAWEANTDYTLTVGVGNRNESEGALTIIGLTSSNEDPGPDNTLSYANANEYLEDPLFLSGAGITVDSGANDPLSFTDYSVNFTTGATPPPGNVVIFLGDEGTAQRSHFDNVRLEVTASEQLPIPVAHFPLDEDGHSPEFGGFVASTVTDVEFGQAGANENTGTSAKFNGTTSVIQHDWNADLNPESFTLTLWAKSDGGAGAWNSPVTSRHDLNNEGQASQGYLIYDNEPAGVWTFWSGNGDDEGNWQVLDGPEVKVGEWQHLAISYDNTLKVKKLYVDGELAAEMDDSLFPNDTTPFNIGAGEDFGTGFRFVGEIDDIGLWDVALREQDILLAMSSGVKALADGGGGGVNPLDPDGDGIFTPVEEKHGLDPNVADADSDNDGDGVIARIEIFELGTLANNPDTDGDGLSDGVETNTGTYVDATDTGTNPTVADTDEDGLKDGEEVPGGEGAGTSPVLADTDDDGFSDGKEVLAGTDPNNAGSKPEFPVVIGYWPFDDPGSAETAELGPGGYVSTVNGDPEWVAGHSGNPGDFAIKFDGEDDSVTTEVSLLNDLPELTMSFWVRMEEEQLGNRIGLVGQNDAVEYGMINPTTMQWWTPAGSIDVEFGPIVEEWTHVAVTLDSEGFKVFSNGEIIGEMAGGGPVSSGDTLNIGGDGVFDNAGNFFLGEIDDVAIWDSALSDAQIADLASKAVCPLGACGGSGFNVRDISLADGNMVNLTWDSIPSRFYDIQASADLSEGSWQAIGVAIPAEGGEALLTSAMVETAADSAMEYFRVMEVGPPPFLESGFEDGLGDWTVAGDGSVWEAGAPTAGPPAAKSGSAVVGTGLAGDYTDGTLTNLRTPVIDTLGVSGVKLNFSYYLEATEGEGGRVNILEADGTLISSYEDLYTGGPDGNTEDWTDVSLRIPKLDPARPFIVEFEFLTGDDGNPDNGAGWFLDDVSISK